MADYTIVKGTFDCGWCNKAAAMLDIRGLSYRVRVLAKPNLIRLADQHGWTTVPMVFYGDAFIGGFEELQKYLDRLG